MKEQILAKIQKRIDMYRKVIEQYSDILEENASASLQKRTNLTLRRNYAVTALQEAVTIYDLIDKMEEERV